MLDFFGLTRTELATKLAEELDLKPFRARQIFSWVYKRNVTDPRLMSDLGVELRERLVTMLRFPETPIKARQISRDGTRKYLFELDNGTFVESVFIKQEHRNTLCVSSQYGCGMGCTFCRTATMGFQRHLSVSEIVRQVYRVAEDCRSFGDTFQNIVFMGMGEPLHNVQNLITAVRILKDDLGFGLGGRKITVSTSGLVPGIVKFGAANLDVNLAVSLNATTDQVRTKIMPVNRAFPLQVLLQALREFPMGKKKQITFEYVMLDGVNDTAADLARLPGLIAGIPSKVNLIPYNFNAGLGLGASPIERIEEWQRELLARGVNTTVRWSKGPDIDAACGQLAVNRAEGTTNRLDARVP